MEIEFDPNKREWTLQNRGLEFEDLARINWQDAILIEDNRFDYGERRHTVMGMLDGRLIVAAFTLRKGAIRVISMRKANARERKLYDQFKE